MLRSLTLFLLLVVCACGQKQKPVAKTETRPTPATAQKSTKAEKSEASSDAAATVVVFNSADADSEELARYYAAKRDIPKDNLIGIKCPTTETISRKEYDEQVADPLRAALVKRGFWKLRAADSPQGRVESSTVRFVALMRGIPLRVGPTFDPYDGDKPNGPPQISTRNEAAVDSELSILGVYSRQVSGAMNNPYFHSDKRFEEIKLPPMLLVCRIDASSQEIARRMIDDSLAAEREGLHGFAYVDARGTKAEGLVEGDKWLISAADIARKKGIPAILDNGEALFPQAYPMTHAAVYFGWYSENVAGPFVQPGFRFERGAIAAHIHSFSAMSIRDPRRFWCAPLLAAGAAATVGNVYEPYLGLTPQFDILLDRLRSGFTFAESCYMSQRFLSWQTTFIGDPLYRPWPASKMASTEPRDEWDAFRIGAEAFYGKDREAGKAKLKEFAQKFHSGVVAEGLGLLQLAVNEPDDAINSFDLASSLYREPADVMRVTINEVFQLKAQNRTPDALSVARKRLAQYAKDPSSEVLRLIEAQMTMASTPAPN